MPWLAPCADCNDEVGITVPMYSQVLDHLNRKLEGAVSHYDLHSGKSGGGCRGSGKRVPQEQMRNAVRLGDDARDEPTVTLAQDVR